MSAPKTYPDKLKVQFEIKDAEQIKYFMDLMELYKRKTVSDMGRFLALEKMDDIKKQGKSL